MWSDGDVSILLVKSSLVALVYSVRLRDVCVGDSVLGVLPPLGDSTTLGDNSGFEISSLLPLGANTDFDAFSSRGDDLDGSDEIVVCLGITPSCVRTLDFKALKAASALSWASDATSTVSRGRKVSARKPEMALSRLGSL